MMKNGGCKCRCDRIWLFLPVGTIYRHLSLSLSLSLSQKYVFI